MPKKLSEQGRGRLVPVKRRAREKTRGRGRPRPILERSLSRRGGEDREERTAFVDCPSSHSFLARRGRNFLVAVTGCALAALLPAAIWNAHPAESENKPVLLYSRYYNAQGETRYLPDGTFKEVLQRLRNEYDVRVENQPLTSATLAGVKLLLIANPSDKAVGNNPPPPHVSGADIKTLTAFVEQGGGLIVMGNQENHNLEIEDVNKLLARFGIQFTNLYTDAKKLVLPKASPIVGGLSWAYYTGNLLLLEESHAAKPRALVMNDLDQKP